MKSLNVSVKASVEYVLCQPWDEDMAGQSVWQTFLEENCISIKPIHFVGFSMQNAKRSGRSTSFLQLFIEFPHSRVFLLGLVN